MTDDRMRSGCFSWRRDTEHLPVGQHRHCPPLSGPPVEANDPAFDRPNRPPDPGLDVVDRCRSLRSGPRAAAVLTFASIGDRVVRSTIRTDTEQEGSHATSRAVLCSTSRTPRRCRALGGTDHGDAGAPPSPGCRRRQRGTRQPWRLPGDHRRRDSHLRNPGRRHREVLGEQRLGATGPRRHPEPRQRARRDGWQPPRRGLGAGRTATAIAAGQVHTCAILDNGAVKCWGYNLFGQLGLGDTAHPRRHGRRDGRQPPRRRTSAPGARPQRSPPATLHTCARLDNGAVKCWGSNGLGRLGFGDTENRG